METNVPVNAGLSRRLFATLIDKTLLFLIVALIIGLYSYFARVYDGRDFVKSAGDVFTIVFLFVMFSAVINWAYHVFFLNHFGGTIGKLLFGIQVFDKETGRFLTNEKAFYRTFAGYTFSSQFLGLGYLKITKKRNNLAWHDELFGTEVRVVGSVWPGALFCFLLIAVMLFVVLPILLSVAALIPSLPR